MPPQENRELIERIEELERVINGLMNAAEADPSVVTTLGLLITGASTKSASAENQTVNEAGSGSYAVLGNPDGFLLIGDKHVPYFN